MDQSTTKKGGLNNAKRYATNHGHDKVAIRYNSGYNCSVVSIKVNNKWVKPIKKGKKND